MGEELLANVKADLKSLVVSSTTGMTAKILRHEYRSVVGIDVPFLQLGYRSYIEFLLSISDTISLKGNNEFAEVVPVLDNKSEHMIRLVSTQKTKVKPGRRPPLKKSHGIFAPTKPAGYQRKRKTAFNDDEFKMTSTTSTTLSSSKSVECESPIYQRGPPKSAGILDDEDIVYYSDEDASVCRMMKHIHINGSRTNDQDNEVPEAIKRKLRILIKENPDGIWCSRLTTAYYDRWGDRLEPEKYGFSSLVEFCGFMKDILNVIRPDKSDWKLFDATKPMPQTNLELKMSKYAQNEFARSSYSASQPALPDWDPEEQTIVGDYPEGAFTIGKIDRQWLLSDMLKDNFVDVLVAEVYDPSKFWIHFSHQQCSVSLTALMDDMQVFYDNNHATYQMRDSDLQVGKYCAAPFNGDYHRAIIVKLNSDSTVKIFYLDYGTVASIEKKHVLYLHKIFCKLPQQCVRARLTNIKPVNRDEMWPRVSAKRFLQLVYQKTLVAEIVHRNDKEMTLDLVLTDTSGSVDLHINDALVKEGYAMFMNEELMDSASSSMCSADFPNKHKERSSRCIPDIYLYPTFGELESGEAPTFCELDSLLKYGMKLDAIFHQYYYYCGRISSVSNWLMNCPDDSLEPEQPVGMRASQSDGLVEADLQGENHSLSVVESYFRGLSPSPTVLAPSPVFEPQLDPSMLNLLLCQLMATPAGLLYYNQQQQLATPYVAPPPGHYPQFISPLANPLFAAPPRPAFKQTVPQTPFSMTACPQRFPQQTAPQPQLNTFQLPLSASPQPLPQQTSHQPPLNTFQRPLSASPQPLPQQISPQPPFNTFQRPLSASPQPLPQQTAPQPPLNTFQRPLSASPQPLSPQLATQLSSFNLPQRSASASPLPLNVSPVVKSESAETPTRKGWRRLLMTNSITKLDVDGKVLHALKVDGEHYFITTEMMRQFTNTKLSLQKILKTTGIQTSFAFRVINLILYPDLYEEVQSVRVPGITGDNCIVHLTPIKDAEYILKICGVKNTSMDVSVAELLRSA